MTHEAEFPQLISAEPVLSSISVSLKMGQLESIYAKPCTNMTKFLLKDVSAMAAWLSVPISGVCTNLRIPGGISQGEQLLGPLTLWGAIELEREIPHFDTSYSAAQTTTGVICD